MSCEPRGGSSTFEGASSVPVINPAIDGAFSGVSVFELLTAIGSAQSGSFGGDQYPTILGGSFLLSLPYSQSLI